MVEKHTAPLNNYPARPQLDRETRARGLPRSAQPRDGDPEQERDPGGDAQRLPGHAEPGGRPPGRQPRRGGRGSRPRGPVFIKGAPPAAQPYRGDQREGVRQHPLIEVRVGPVKDHFRVKILFSYQVPASMKLIYEK